MGGSGSGRRWRFDSKPVIEDGLVLSISRLMQNKSLRPGHYVSGGLVWSVVDTGKEIASIGYEANLREPNGAWMRLKYNHNGNPRDYKVRLITTRPNFGGMRWWFICPVSGRKAAKLYSPPGQPLFVSRQVYKLAYRSQNQDPISRNIDQAQEIRRKLGGDMCLDSPFPDKPKGMHRKTYQKLEDREARLSDAVLCGFRARFGYEL